MIDLRIFLFLLLAAGVQTLFAVQFPILVCTLVVIAPVFSRGQNIRAAVFAGLLNDSLSPSPLGISIPMCLLIVEAIRLIRDEVFIDQVITYTILGAGAGLFQEFYCAILYGIGGLRPIEPQMLLVRIVIGLISGALLAPALFLVRGPIRHLIVMNRRRRMS
ncbi:MAG: rod shape-determining protein MreD [Kiritimatiellales bacterium]